MSHEKGEKKKRLTERQGHLLLEKEPGVIYIPSEYHLSIPTSFNEALNADPEIADFLPGLARNSVLYLNAPLILDGFETDHESRRAWRKTMLQKHGPAMYEFLLNNKLRNNKLSGPLQFLTSIAKIAKKHNLGSEAVRELIAIEERYERTLVNYKNLSSAEKMGVARAVSRMCLEVLNLISKPLPH